MKKIYLLQLWISLLLGVSCIPPKEKKLPFTGTFLQAEEYFIQNKFDSSYQLFVKAMSESTDSLEIATIYNYMGIIQFYSGDYFGSQEVLLNALQILDPTNPEHKTAYISVYNELGRTSSHLENFEQAIQYYNQCLGWIQEGASARTIQNNKAIALQRLGRYDEALQLLNQLIAQSDQQSNLYAKLLSNKARTEWLKNPTYQPLNEFWKALEIRLNNKDNWGLNASYSHLSEYYYSIKNYDSSLYYAQQMNAITKQIESADDEVESLKKILLIPLVKDRQEYFERYIHLRDSLQLTRNAAKNQFALIRFETEKAKSDNLILERKNQQKLIYLISIVAVLMIIIVISFYHIKSIKRKTAQIVNENKLIISQKVHDVVANGLYTLMSRVEYDQIIDKEILLDHLEILYEKSRDISYEDPTTTSNDLSILSKKISSFSSNETMINIVGSLPEVEKNLDPLVHEELVHVIGELLVNMKKHSKAKNVSIKFDQEDDDLFITYIDDGIGIDNNYKKGNGINNTEFRIKKINGDIKFERSSTGGLAIKIKVPNKI